MAELNPVNPLVVVQLSDCHLGAEPGDRLLGMDTDDSLDKVISQLRLERPHIDLLVCSGDLAAEGDRSAYQRLLPKLDGLAEQVVWLPGNHDDIDLMQGLVGYAGMPFQLQLAGWQLVFFDSSIAGEVGGALKPEQLAQFKAVRAAEQPGLVFMHHHLVPVGCEWLDEQRVSNAQSLFELLAQSGGAAAIVSGHVHQETDTEHQGQRVLTTPSTCIQFAPHSQDFAVDDRNPGYRWLELYADGHLDTGVSRVSGASFYVDHNARGYQ